ncbi:MAG: thiamine pyrophosphate-dependent dehydrogenase E1 component subunit alpha [Bacillota bacterium]
MAVDKTTLLDFYRKMVLIRRFEETVEEYSKKGHVPGFIHLGVGQEAAQAGAMAAFQKGDFVLPDHRSHGVCLLVGTPTREVLAEIFGKETGVCRGKGGSMHIADFARGNVGNNAIQGSTMVTALGLAYAAQFKQTKAVTFNFIGDGTVGRGEFHESLNLAGVWKLPIVYVLVNNQYAISTRAVDAHPLEKLSQMGCAYDIPGVTVDGNDVEAVAAVVTEAAERARRGEGASLVELVTYRWQGHFSGDPASYRPEEEVKAWKEKDPIKRVREQLLAKGWATAEDIKGLDARVEAEIADAVTFAIESPVPKVEEATHHVYVGREVAGK